MPVLSLSQARAAGLLYLLIIVAGLTAEFVIRAPLATAIPGGSGDVAAILRLSALADAAMVLADVGLAVLLFLMLRAYGEGLALAAMVFRLVQAALIAAGLLVLLAGAGGMIVDPAATLALHATAYDIGLLFFGVNAVLTGLLLARIGGVARLLGAGIAVAGLVYLVGSTLRIGAPQLVALFEPAYLVAVVAEVSFCLWLLAGAGRASRATA